jgi:hypothetical protein
LAGIMNFENEDREFIYNLDLSQFGFPIGQYWVHSLDENRSEGQYETNGEILSFGTHIPANGTRLFLISRDMPLPGYSIETFPAIPSIHDVSQPTPPIIDGVIGENLILVAAGILTVGVSIIVVILYTRRKRATQ